MNQKTSTIFFGTHHFATIILEGLLGNPNISVDLVITQPDKPVGRHQELQKSPVAILAEKHGLRIEKPETLKNYQIPIKADLGVTAQYGLLIPKHILDAPIKGILNVHTSLLPKYRGASPIQSALVNGETETGVTIMNMDVGLDTGPILLQKSLVIDPDDTYATLDQKLAQLGSEALLEAIPGYMNGTIAPQEQDNSQATSCKQLSREDGRIDWNHSAQEIYNQYRGLTPWPGVWTTWNEKRLKILACKPSAQQGKSGIAHVNGDHIFIGTAEGSLEVTMLQLEGKPAMDAKTFVNGYKHIDGQLLK